MPNPRLAARYAKSLTDLAVEVHQLDAVFQDMQSFDVTCRESRELINFLKSPVINADKKEKIFAAIFGTHISDLSRKFVVLLIKKGREGYLPEIAKAVIARYRKINNIREVKITTATALSEPLKQELIEKIKTEIPGQQIELTTAVRERLIGGFILETDNTVFDASIARDLYDIKKQFNKNIYVADI